MKKSTNDEMQTAQLVQHTWSDLRKIGLDVITFDGVKMSFRVLIGRKFLDEMSVGQEIDLTLLQASNLIRAMGGVKDEKQ